MQQFVLFVLFFAGFSHALKSCETCLGSGYHYCADSKLCNTPACVNTIKEVLNCPHAPNATYDDNEARTKWLPLFGAGATNAKMAQKCFDNNWPTLKVSKRFLVNCSDPSPILPPTECAMITAVDVSQKILVMTFRATLGNTQLGEEVLNFLVAKKQFFDVGKVFEFFYDAYLALWRAGLEQEIRSLKYRYPDYELWFAYSFRVVHHHDIVPHVPLQNAPVDHDRMYHHRTEVWYNNDMSVGSSYQICPEADGLYCVNQQVDLSWNDHTHYFNTDLNVYGDLGCPKK